jgi:hypothetical protein
MLLGKPVFSLRVDMEHCAHVVYVNGGLVRQSLEQTPIHAEYPVNHWLRSGKNDIEVHMLKWEGEPDDCNVQVTLRRRETKPPVDTVPLTLLTLMHDAKNAPRNAPTQGSSPSGAFYSGTGQAVNNGDLRVGAASVQALTGRWSQVHILSRSFEIPLPFPEWAFFRGERQILEWEFESEQQQQALYSSLLATYQDLHGMLSSGDVDAFVAACEERSRETDLAYFKTIGDTRASLRKHLVSAMNDSTLELASLDVPPHEAWTYTVGSAGTLVALTQGNRASSILRFQARDDTPFSMVFPVVFRKEHQRYIVTR